MIYEFIVVHIWHCRFSLHFKLEQTIKFIKKNSFYVKEWHLHFKHNAFYYIFSRFIWRDFPEISHSCKLKWSVRIPADLQSEMKMLKHNLFFFSFFILTRIRLQLKAPKQNELNSIQCFFFSFFFHFNSTFGLFIWTHTRTFYLFIFVKLQKRS